RADAHARQGQRAQAAPLGLLRRGRAPGPGVGPESRMGARRAASGEVVPRGRMALMKLYESAPSSASFRVRIALNLKGLPYESLLLDLRANDHQTPEYGKVNPQHAVPSLVDGERTLTQSLAIIEYLEETQ